MITNRELQNILDQVNKIFKSQENRISELESRLQKKEEPKPSPEKEEKPKRKPGRPRLSDNG